MPDYSKAQKTGLNITLFDGYMHYKSVPLTDINGFHWDCEFCEFSHINFDTVGDHEKYCSKNHDAIAM